MPDGLLVTPAHSIQIGRTDGIVVGTEASPCDCHCEDNEAPLTCCWLVRFENLSVNNNCIPGFPGVNQSYRFIGNPNGLTRIVKGTPLSATGCSGQILELSEDGFQLIQAASNTTCSDVVNPLDMLLQVTVTQTQNAPRKYLFRVRLLFSGGSGAGLFDGSREIEVPVVGGVPQVPTEIRIDNGVTQQNPPVVFWGGQAVLTPQTCPTQCPTDGGASYCQNLVLNVGGNTPLAGSWPATRTGANLWAGDTVSAGHLYRFTLACNNGEWSRTIRRDPGSGLAAIRATWVARHTGVSPELMPESDWRLSFVTTGGGSPTATLSCGE